MKIVFFENTTGKGILRFFIISFLALLIHFIVYLLVTPSHQIPTLSKSTSIVNIAHVDIKNIVEAFDSAPETSNNLNVHRNEAIDIIENQKSQVALSDKTNNFKEIKELVQPDSLAKQDYDIKQNLALEFDEGESINNQNFISGKVASLQLHSDSMASGFQNISQEVTRNSAVAPHRFPASLHYKSEALVKYSVSNEMTKPSMNLSGAEQGDIDWGDQLRALMQYNVVFPKKALSRGLKGIVMLEVEIFRDGTVGEVVIHKSSGYASLDRSALKGAKKVTNLTTSYKANSKKVYFLPIKFE